MHWQDKLTKAELKHLKDSQIRTLNALKDVRRAQKIRQESMPNSQGCLVCHSIALKLGLES